MKIYLQQNKDKKPGSKQPDLRLSQITDKGEFIEVGALWKSQSGKGYSGQIELIKVEDLMGQFDIEQAENQKARDEARKEKAEEVSVEATDEIDESEIPFN